MRFEFDDTTKELYTYMLESSNIPSVFSDETKLLYTPENDSKVFKWLNACCEALATDTRRIGKDLFLYSKYSGNGKTTWACRLLLCTMYRVSKTGAANIQNNIDPLHPEFDLHKQAYFFSVPRFLMLSKDFNHPESIAEAQKMKKDAQYSLFVVFDEIGNKYYSEYDMNELYSIIDYRINRHDLYQNIFTSNIAPEELIAYCGERLVRRILEYAKLMPFTEMRPYEGLNNK